MRSLDYKRWRSYSGTFEHDADVIHWSIEAQNWNPRCGNLGSNSEPPVYRKLLVGLVAEILCTRGFVDRWIIRLITLVMQRSGFVMAWNVFKFCTALRGLGSVMILLVLGIVGVTHYAIVITNYGPALQNEGLESAGAFFILILFHALLGMLFIDWSRWCSSKLEAQHRWRERRNSSFNFSWIWWAWVGFAATDEPKGFLIFKKLIL